MTAYMRWLAAERDLDFEGDYHRLWQWSVDDLDAFWRSIWDYFEVRPRAPSAVLGDAGDARRRVVPGRHAELRGAPVPRRGRRRSSRSSTRPSCASSARSPGASCAPRVAARRRRPARARRRPRRPRRRVPAEHPRGDHRASAPPPRSARSGRRCSPDFGARSVIDRFAQIEPKVLFAVDGYRYGGKDFDRLDVVAGLEAEMPGLERTVLLPYLDPDARPRPGWRSRSPGTSSIDRGRGRRARVRGRRLRLTRSGSSTRRAPPACRRRSSRATAGSCSSTSRS